MMNRLYDNKIIQNIFVWLAVFVILLGSGSDESLVISIVVILFIAPPIYITNIYILPLIRTNPVRFILLVLLNAIVFSGIVILFFIKYVGEPFQMRMFSFVGLILLALSIGAAMKLARDSIERRRKDKEAELTLLKGQLNPHFLFNTLNNLYGLSVIKSDKLPELMLKLSGLLRYSIYETSDRFVPIQNELTYLENYIALESLRLDEQVSVKFNITGITELEDQQIAPMLLIVFVENAFKHAGNTSLESTNIEFDVFVDEGKIVFQSSNSLGNDIANDNVNKASGLGLKNVKKRLSLIYPNRHELTINKTGDSYTVKLKIQI